MIYYDFGFYLSIAALVTGLVVLIDKLKWRKERIAKGLEYDEKGHEKMPAFIDISRSFFPVIFIVLILRSFLYEPYRIPSGSMNPGLYDGDFILVNKYAYGIRLPIFNTKIIPIGSPERGDVIVFHPPQISNPEKGIQPAYIKRLIGMPGDLLEWRNGTLTITPKCEASAACEKIVIEPYLVSSVAPDLVENKQAYSLYKEVVGEVEHELLYWKPDFKRQYENIYGRSPSLSQSWTRVIPEGKYMGIGDHRDNSLDTRAWLEQNKAAFIDEDALIGRAAAKWLFMDFADEPDFTVPLLDWPVYFPRDISFDRVGPIK